MKQLVNIRDVIPSMSRFIIRRLCVSGDGEFFLRDRVYYRFNLSGGSMSSLQLEAYGEHTVEVTCDVFELTLFSQYTQHLHHLRASGGKYTLYELLIRATCGTGNK